jgi:hypothetical protein
MQHGMMCFARLVRSLLGPGAVADEKLDFGASLMVLGVDVTIRASGYALRPTRDKVSEWLASLESAIAAGKLRGGDASKLAGRLSWGCAQLFRRFGRAMLRPIFDQACRGCPSFF